MIFMVKNDLREAAAACQREYMRRTSAGDGVEIIRRHIKAAVAVEQAENERLRGVIDDLQKAMGESEAHRYFLKWQEAEAALRAAVAAERAEIERLREALRPPCPCSAPELLAALRTLTAHITGSAILMDNISLAIFEDAVNAVAKAESHGPANT